MTNLRSRPGDPDTQVVALANGVRVVVVRLPHVATAAASVFVRSGSQHESAAQSGIGHVIEHMAFKGTRSRDCQRINLDAERLGAEVNAHTDRDHTAFHMRGRARDAESFVRMLGDIVRESTFPADELERERQVILHELAENQDDPAATAFELFDRACYGAHPAASPVIGTRANIRRFTRDELAAWVERQYTGANTVVGVAGNVDPDAIAAAAQAVFGDMPRGRENVAGPPPWVGGIRARRLTGASQADIVLGFPIPPLRQVPTAFAVAAALLGEGMSSPLLDRLRERRGLVYHADCWTDVRDAWGQFVIEATTAPEKLRETVEEIAALLRESAASVDPVGLERARNQVEVRTLCDHEVPDKRLEAAAVDLFALGRVRAREEVVTGIHDVGPDGVRDALARMLAAGAAVGIAGSMGRSATAQVARILGLPGR